MTLFTSNPIENILPFDGHASYLPDFLTAAEAAATYQALLHSIEWKHDKAFIFGRHIITNRKVAWYGDGNFDYAYSKITRTALPWTAELQSVRTRIEATCCFSFNSCLLNLYHNGTEGMAWHSDDEKCMGDKPFIASLSLGAARRFSFKHKRSGDKVDILLEPGSLLIMKENTQTNWLHCLPKSARVHNPRINLTFRRFIE